jgi:sugar O-acyltransferase (sialic acid O-acetyltransferase NeuD family)
MRQASLQFQSSCGANLNVRVLIIGAGGHGQVVADVLLSALSIGSGIQPVGFLDDEESLRHQWRLGLPVLGSFDEHRRFDHDALIVALGDNSARASQFEYLLACGERFAIAQHPSAVLSANCEVGQGSMVCAGVVVSTGAIIGSNVILNTSCSVDHHNVIGDHVHIAPGARLGGHVTIGQGTLIGIGATVLPGCRVGSWSIVGAGAVVTEDLSDGIVAVGSPARTVSERSTARMTRSSHPDRAFRSAV